MSKVIWKYELEVMDMQPIEMPVGAEILCLQTQGLKPCLWALVEPNVVTEERYIETFGTGHIIQSIGINRTYIGTYQTDKQLVFHVFERID